MKNMIPAEPGMFHINGFVLYHHRCKAVDAQLPARQQLVPDWHHTVAADSFGCIGSRLIHVSLQKNTQVTTGWGPFLLNVSCIRVMLLGMHRSHWRVSAFTAPRADVSTSHGQRAA